MFFLGEHLFRCIYQQLDIPCLWDQDTLREANLRESSRLKNLLIGMFLHFAFCQAHIYNRKNEMCRVGKRNAMVLVENEM